MKTLASIAHKQIIDKDTMFLILAIQNISSNQVSVDNMLHGTPHTMHKVAKAQSHWQHAAVLKSNFGGLQHKT